MSPISLKSYLIFAWRILITQIDAMNTVFVGIFART